MMDDSKKDDLEDFDLDLEEDFDLDDDSLDDLDDDVMDLDDLDDLDALDDDDWSDLDDDDNAAGSASSASGSGFSSQGGGSKSNKLLVYGMIGGFALIVLFVGGRQVASLFSSGDERRIVTVSEASQKKSAAQDLVSAPLAPSMGDEKIPPMPVAVSNEADAEQAESAAVELADSALTPIPAFDDQESVMPSDLPPLDTEDVKPVQVSAVEPVVQEEPEIMAMQEPIAAISPVENIPSVSETRDAPAVVTSFDDGRVEALEGRLEGTEESLDRIMQALERLESGLDKVSADVDKAMALAKTKAAAVQKKPVSSPAPAQKKAPVKSVSKPVAKKPVLYKEAPKAAPQNAVSSWVLKSAQPGQAVVAESKTNYLRSVEVGSTLSGVGKITSITQENGRWIVQGTKGRIAQ